MRTSLLLQEVADARAVGARASPGARREKGDQETGRENRNLPGERRQDTRGLSTVLANAPQARGAEGARATQPVRAAGCTGRGPGRAPQRGALKSGLCCTPKNEEEQQRTRRGRNQGDSEIRAPETPRLGLGPRERARKPPNSAKPGRRQISNAGNGTDPEAVNKTKTRQKTLTFISPTSERTWAKPQGSQMRPRRPRKWSS